MVAACRRPECRKGEGTRTDRGMPLCHRNRCPYDSVTGIKAARRREALVEVIAETHIGEVLLHMLASKKHRAYCEESHVAHPELQLLRWAGSSLWKTSTLVVTTFGEVKA